MQTLADLITQLKVQLRDLSFQYFNDYVLFGSVWWLLVALIILPLIVWWKLLDKKRLVEISAFGLLLALIATFLDVIGSDYVLWLYPVQVLPYTAVLLPVDFVVLPVIQMYVYQQCTKWGKYLLFSTIAAAVQSFIAEPLAMLIGQYSLVHWNILWSFPIYIVMDISVKFLIERFKKRQEKEIQQSHH